MRKHRRQQAFRAEIDIPDSEGEQKRGKQIAGQGAAVRLPEYRGLYCNGQAPDTAAEDDPEHRRRVPAGQIPAEKGLHHRTLRNLHAGRFDAARSQTGRRGVSGRAEHDFYRACEQNRRKCKQPETQIRKPADTQRLYPGGPADQHSGERRGEQRCKRLRQPPGSCFQPRTEQQMAAEPDVAQTDPPAERRKAGASAYSAFRSARMWAGVVPQQPPTKDAPAPISVFMCRANSAGDME